MQTNYCLYPERTTLEWIVDPGRPDSVFPKRLHLHAVLRYHMTLGITAEGHLGSDCRHLISVSSALPPLTAFGGQVSIAKVPPRFVNKI